MFTRAKRLAKERSLRVASAMTVLAMGAMLCAAVAAGIGELMPQVEAQGPFWSMFLYGSVAGLVA